MDKAAIKGVIDFLKASLVENGLSLNFIAIFGSAMKGEMRKDSDLDLIIVSEDFKGKDIFERSYLTMKAELATRRKFGIPMDILNMSPEEYNDTGLIESRIFEDYLASI